MLRSSCQPDGLHKCRFIPSKDAYCYVHYPFSFVLNFQRNNFSASRKSFGNGTSNKLEVHVGKGLCPAPVIRQVRKIQHRRLRADEKIRQHWIVGILAAILAERHARAPGGICIQRDFFKITQIFFHRLARASACREFAISYRTDGELPALRPMFDGLQAGAMMRMIFVQPGNDYRSVHENHGRVLRNNSSPEMSPSQVPARARMCSTMALRAAGSWRT